MVLVWLVGEAGVIANVIPVGEVLPRDIQQVVVVARQPLREEAVGRGDEGRFAVQIDPTL